MSKHTLVVLGFPIACSTWLQIASSLTKEAKAEETDEDSTPLNGIEPDRDCDVGNRNMWVAHLNKHHTLSKLFDELRTTISTSKPQCQRYSAKSDFAKLDPAK